MLVSHWCKLFEKTEASPRELYAAVEEALQERQIPSLTITRVDWHEGGLLSARREYLRLTRERLIFDICAAPFGTGFFVSSRLVEEPLKIGIVGVLSLFLFGGLLIFIFTEWFGIFWGLLLLLICLGVGVWFLRSLISRGLTDVDATLMRTPVLGPIYERFFRANTYYRIDTTMMFQQAVHTAVLQAVDQVLNAKGDRPMSAEERKPILADLFRKYPR